MILISAFQSSFVSRQYINVHQRRDIDVRWQRTVIFIYAYIRILTDTREIIITIIVIIEIRNICKILYLISYYGMVCGN